MFTMHAYRNARMQNAFFRMPDVRKGVVFPSATCLKYKNGFVPGLTLTNGRYMGPSSGTRRKMEFNRVKKSLFRTEKQKRKDLGERVQRCGVATKTIIDFDGVMAPPPKERRTGQNTDRGNSARGTIESNASKGSRESGERSEEEGGEQGTRTAELSGY